MKKEVKHRPLKRKDLDKLKYIHSNRFITPQLFHSKFYQGKSLDATWQFLRRLKEMGYLKEKKFGFQGRFVPAVVYLSYHAINELKSLGQIIAGRVAEVKIPSSEVDHHLSVISLRIALEKDPFFKSLFWVSDYELNSGIDPLLKWKHEALTDAEKIIRRGEFKPNGVNRPPRIVDGYFRAEILNGTDEKPSVEGFVLEFENSPYSYRRIIEIVVKIDTLYPKSKKLIVSASPENSKRINRIIWRFMHLNVEYRADKRTKKLKPHKVVPFKERGGNPSLWNFADYKSVINKTFSTSYRKLRAPDEPNKPNKDEVN